MWRWIRTKLNLLWIEQEITLAIAIADRTEKHVKQTRGPDIGPDAANELYRAINECTAELKAANSLIRRVDTNLEAFLLTTEDRRNAVATSAELQDLRRDIAGIRGLHQEWNDYAIGKKPLPEWMIDYRKKPRTRKKPTKKATLKRK